MFRRPRGYERLRKAVLLRDNGICWLCGLAGATEVDHVLPRDKGGTHSMQNLRAAHKRCNSAKGNKSVFPAANISQRWK